MCASIFLVCARIMTSVRPHAHRLEGILVPVKIVAMRENRSMQR